MSWCDLDLTFDLVIVTLTYNVLSRLYLGSRQLYDVDSWQRQRTSIGVVGVHHNF